MRRIMHYIDLHYAEDIRISDLAVSFYLNASYMSTLIRKKTGKTYTDIIAEKRIDCAKNCCAAPMKRCWRLPIWLGTMNMLISTPCSSACAV